MKKKDIKILLVDDEQDILEIVGYNLSQEGYQIVTASNGKEAIAKAKKQMSAAAKKLEFLEAAQYRDQVIKLEDELKSKGK